MDPKLCGSPTRTLIGSSWFSVATSTLHGIQLLTLPDLDDCHRPVSCTI
jgi:hypothetical protein